jgi:uncharacterized delta-60 repeat protein
VTGWFENSATFGQGEPNETVLTSTGGYDTFIARYNPDGTLDWVKHTGGTFDDGGIGITALSDNSTVVTGWFENSVTFGQGELNQTVLTSVGLNNIFIARYNPDGTLAWAKRAGGDSDYEFAFEVGNGITTLSDNSTVATGYFSGSATFGPSEPNQTILTSAGGWDIFIARYNPDGTLVWAKRAGGASFEDIGYGITTLSDDSTVATGAFWGSATFGLGEPNQTILTTIANGFDIFIARYNPDGTLAWAKCAGGMYDFDLGYRISALSDNSTVVTGVFDDSATFGSGEPNQTVLTSPGGTANFVARYNPDGTLAWAKHTAGVSNGYGITTLSDNSAVVTGKFEGLAIFGSGEPNQTALTSAGDEDIFIACYNPDGTLAWANRAGGESDDQGLGITSLTDDSTVVTGGFEGSAIFGPGEPYETVLTSDGESDIFIARFAP